MTAAHTPTPWAVRETIGGKRWIYSGETRVAKAASGKRKAENEAFIVRACNSHDALVAALERIERELRRAKTTGLHPYQVREIHEWIPAALKAAKGAE